MKKIAWSVLLAAGCASPPAFEENELAEPLRDCTSGICETFESSASLTSLDGMFVKKVSYQCDEGIGQWARVGTSYLGGPPHGRYSAQEGPGVYSYPNDSMELLLSKNTQNNPYGYMSVDFYLSNSVPINSNVHGIVMTNYAEIGNTCAQHGSGSAVHGLNNFPFYGVIFGSFGDPEQGWNQKLGFVLERALVNGAARCVTLFPATFVQNEVDNSFPGGWYRIRSYNTPTSYGYQVFRYSGGWVPMGQREISFSALSRAEDCPGWDASVLSPGRIGLSAYWLRPQDRIVWDHVKSNWVP